MIRIVPITIKGARTAVERWHSHHHAPLSGLCAVAVESDGALACVAILGRPAARMLNANGATAEVMRVASSGEVLHAASAALGAITRTGIALGYRRLVSYTILGEAGTIYRACNWWPTAITGGGEWSRRTRWRESGQQVGAKVRWEFGPDAASRDAAVADAVRAAVGTIAIPGRRETLPLFSGASQ